MENYSYEDIKKCIKEIDYGLEGDLKEILRLENLARVKRNKMEFRRVCRIQELAELEVTSIYKYECPGSGYYLRYIGIKRDFSGKIMFEFQILRKSLSETNKKFKMYPCAEELTRISFVMDYGECLKRTNKSH